MADSETPLPPRPDTLTGLVLRLVGLLSRRRRLQMLALLGLTLASAFAELVSVGAIFPFLAVVADPERVFRQTPWLADWLAQIGVEKAQLLSLLLAVFVLAAVMAGAVRVLLVWANARFVQGVGLDFCVEIYRRILYQPYSFHVARNSSDILASLQRASGVTRWVLNPLIQMGSAAFLFAGILMALLLVDFRVALGAASCFGLLYGGISLLSRRALQRTGQVINRLTPREFRLVQEGLGGIRDTLLDRSQPRYLQRYRMLRNEILPAFVRNDLVAGLAKPVIESLSLVVIACAALLVIFNRGGIGGALPVLGALAIGAQKLLPQMQQLYSSWSTVLSGKYALADLIAALEEPLPKKLPAATPENVKWNSADGIIFSELGFRYREELPWVLRGVDVRIAFGTRVGLIGRTGSGKSTLIDLLMGLLSPSVGELRVGGVHLDADSIPAWQSRIAHVPQAIFLADCSIAENIAIGEEASAINRDLLISAARKAQLLDFIESLPQGFDTQVGERGVRLSGGQRQRIGLARAFYKQADVLVLDEATSALDSATEQSVMAAIEALGNEVTVVMIAHRLTTLRNCHVIHEMADGRVLRSGSWLQLCAEAAELESPDPLAEAAPLEH